MNCQEILQHQLANDFKNDIVVALTSNGGINPAISTELQKLTSKKNFLIKELRELWKDRGTSNFMPAATIYEINLSHATKLEDKQKFDLASKQAKLSEKNLILEVSFTSFGFNPTTRKFDYKVAFNRDPSVLFRRFDTLTVIEPNSLSVNLFSTLKKFLKEFKELHLLDEHITQIFLYFSKVYLPDNYSALSRFGGDAKGFFESLLSLADSENEAMKIRVSLDNLKRNPGEPISSTLLKIDSLYSALYNMSMPHKEDKEVSELVQRHKIYLLGAFISTEALKMLMSYSKERTGKGRSLSLEEIVSFVNRLEQNVPSARLTMTVNMPKGGSSLDSIQSSNTTLNGFNSIDGHFAQGVFTAAFQSHQSRRNFNKSNNRGRNFIRGTGSTFNRHSTSSYNGTRSPNTFSGNIRPYNGFPQARSQQGVSRGFQRAARRGQFSNSRSRGLQRSRNVGQGRGQSRDGRSRSPGQRFSRSPEKKFMRSGRNENLSTLPRSRSNSRGRSKMTCLRCGSGSHLASACTLYKNYSDTHCKRCNLLHATRECKQNDPRVHAGELVMDEELEPEFVDVEQEALDVQDVEAEQEQDVLESNLVYDEAYEQYPENTWENEEQLDELSPYFLF